MSNKKLIIDLYKEILINFLKEKIPNTKPPKKPIAIFVCGMTASGKSILSELLSKELFKSSSYIYLNPDVYLMELQKLHPDKLLSELYPIVSDINIKHIEPMAIESKQNLLFDKVCSYSNEVKNKITLLKSIGYKVIMALNYVSLETSKKRLKIRNKTDIRKIPLEILDKLYKTITDEYKNYMNFEKINELRLYNNESKIPKLIYKKINNENNNENNDENNNENNKNNKKGIILYSPACLSSKPNFYFSLKKYC